MQYCHPGTETLNVLVLNSGVTVNHYGKGHAIAQAVRHRLPIAAAWVQDQVRSCGICGGQSGTGTGFLRLRNPYMNKLNAELWQSGTGHTEARKTYFIL
jgi:hypothetical protein